MPRLIAACLAALLLFTPALAAARAGGGASFGSRGSRTFLAPPRTNVAPFAAPLGHTETLPPASGYGAGYGDYPPPRRPSFFTGFMGGLIGAGIGGLLLGHGFFDLFSLAAVIGFVVQIVLLVLIVRALLNLFAWRRRVAATPRPAPAAAPPRGTPVTLQRADYAAFERLLLDVQAAWTDADPGRMRLLTTPEMLRRFGAQIADLRQHGQRNEARDVRLEKGELSEAWAESGQDYATVAMRFSMIDVTRDSRGYVVDGSPDERVTVSELWTFIRPAGGAWVLSAIQQTN